MTISLFELFKIGVGPSSSHTVGPMVAARRFTVWLDEAGLLTKTGHVEADLYGSLALTGKGHAADTAIVAGLAGEIPASTSLAAIKAHWDRAESEGFLYLLGRVVVGPRPHGTCLDVLHCHVLVVAQVIDGLTAR